MAVLFARFQGTILPRLAAQRDPHSSTAFAGGQQMRPGAPFRVTTQPYVTASGSRCRADGTEGCVTLVARGRLGRLDWQGGSGAHGRQLAGICLSNGHGAYFHSFAWAIVLRLPHDLCSRWAAADVLDGGCNVGSTRQ